MKNIDVIKKACLFFRGTHIGSGTLYDAKNMCMLNIYNQHFKGCVSCTDKCKAIKHVEGMLE